MLRGTKRLSSWYYVHHLASNTALKVTKVKTENEELRWDEEHEYSYLQNDTYLFCDKACSLSVASWWGFSRMLSGNQVW